MDRVEVIRGPGSALYGSDAFHSVTSFRSWDSDEDIIETGVRSGQFGYFSAFARGRQEFSNELKLTGALAISHNSDSEVEYDYTHVNTGENVSLDNSEEYESYNANFKLQYKGTYLGSYYNKTYSDKFVGLGASTSNRGGRQSGFNEVTNTYVKIGHKTDLWEKYNLDTMAYRVVTKTGFYYDLGTVDPQSVTLEQKVSNYSEGVKVFFKNDNTEEFYWVTGMGYTRQYIENTSRFITTESEYPYEGFRRYTKYLLAHTVTKMWDDKLRVLAGIRLDDYADIDDLVETPRLGLIFNLQKNRALKFLYGNAFRAPAATEVAGSATFLGNSDLEPDRYL